MSKLTKVKEFFLNTVHGRIVGLALLLVLGLAVGGAASYALTGGQSAADKTVSTTEPAVSAPATPELTLAPLPAPVETTVAESPVATVPEPTIATPAPSSTKKAAPQPSSSPTGKAPSLGNDGTTVKYRGLVLTLPDSFEQLTPAGDVTAMVSNNADCTSDEGCSVLTLESLNGPGRAFDRNGALVGCSASEPVKSQFTVGGVPAMKSAVKFSCGGGRDRYATEWFVPSKAMSVTYVTPNSSSLPSGLEGALTNALWQ